jgi:hypothetical protein
MQVKILISVVILGLLLTGCAQPNEAERTQDEAEVNVYDAFLDQFRQHCGNAYAGRLTLEPPGDTMLDGDELLIVHFRECEEDQLKLPFHIERLDGTWDRSRTWIFTRTETGLDIRHDHRKPDGTEDDFTMYGGPSHGVPTENVMEFISHERTEETGQYRGWRIIIEPGERYVYGTFRDGEWSWRVDFDLTAPVDEPPAPWGHE